MPRNDFENHFESVRNDARSVFRAVIALQILFVLFALGMGGVIIWAIIKVINHYYA